MAQWVEGIHPTRPALGSAAAPTQEANDDDEIEAPSIPLLRSVLNECERSFAAADKTRAKSSSQFFDDKGLMGLLCHHNNLLFLANIKTPGKRQFYMFALIEALLQHLPTDFVVGFLYDIACQLQRSAVKFDFLPPAYMERLEWAVYVLHSYGHGTACQAMSQWNDTIFKEDADPIYVHFAEQEYAKAHEKLSKLAESSKYIQVRMNAAAAKTKLRSCLRQRKFELNRVKYAKLTTHIEDVVKHRDQSIKDLCKLYNNLCKQLQELIDLHHAPRNAVAPGPINEKDIWGLDVDADVWLDIGLTDIDQEVDPPLRMSSNSVRKGIQALLKRDQCDEEEQRLYHECRALRWWMAEEWDVVGWALQLAGKANEEAVVFQLKLRQSELTKLTAAWEKPLRQIPYPTEGLPPWGPSDRDVLQIRIEDVSARTRDGAPSWGNDKWKDTNGDEDSSSETESNGESLPYNELEAFERGGIVWDEELLL
ncbi:unnamed protein product [Mycena citricolor]|uniref:Uncharacterized protein n=1 Tax=Mycena citricolor TaxID=2018698 RepID=A0AAD2HJI1_9AGAR|nr:unnamed protein product [Mycena citricolor]